jgi:hypothetical protein
VTTTWNPADKSANITLSGGDLNAATSQLFAQNAVRAIASAYSGKKYWEITVGALSSGAAGVANSSAALGSFIGDANGVGWGSNGDVSTGGGGGTTWVPWDDGDVLCLALDLDNNRLWGRVGAGNWNNNASADPATNTLGHNISAITGPFFPAISMRCTGGTDDMTANFGATAYAQTPPSGFGNW